MSDRHQYQNPPIKEAICRFRFESEQDWDPLLPGRLQRALNDDYTGKAQEQRSLSVRFDAYGKEPPNVNEVATTQLVKEDGTRMVGVGHNVLSVHMLYPYQDPGETEDVGWEEFKDRISKALSAYWEEAKPSGVKKIGIRYANEIMIPQEEARVDDYIRDALPRLKEDLFRLAWFSCRIVYLYEDGARIFVRQKALEPIDEHVRILLDLNVVWESDDELISQGDAFAKAEDLRNRERTAFEAFITDKSRSLFDA